MSAAAIEPDPIQPDPIQPDPVAALQLQAGPPASAPPPPPPSIAATSSFRSASSFGRSPSMATSSGAALSIGELDQTIFDCPACSRPLALGTRRCPGCKTRLVNGVVLTKASGFAVVGLAVGVLAGAGGGFLFGANRAAAPAAIVAGGPSAVPSAGSVAPPSAAASVAPVATPAPTGTPASDVPPWTKTAFLQVLTTNGRLATAADDLRAALAAPSFDASEVAQTLRSISADTVFAEQLAARIAAWPGAGAAGPALVEFYASVHDAAATGLVASVRNTAAYQAAAKAMLKVLDGGPAVDATVRATALAAGLDLGEAPEASAVP